MLGNSLTKEQALLDLRSLTWTPTGQGKFDVNNEEGWTPLWDRSVLTVDAYVGTGTCDSNSELYLTRSGSWRSAGSTIQQLPDCSNIRSFEIGPQVLRPDGTVIVFGGTTTGTAHTSIFQQDRQSWSAGPDIPAVDGVPYTLADAPAALLPSGDVLFAASPSNWTSVVHYPRPTHFFEVEYGTNSISQVADPSATDSADLTSFQWNFLVLPTGQILVCETDSDNIWIYTPKGKARREWAPVITEVPNILNTETTYTLEGLRLNGFSLGASYGDDVQAATNYPIVRIVNATTGHVFYARTLHHRNRAIGLDDKLTSTRFTVPASSEIEAGPSYLYVVANGIASEPVWVYINPSFPVAGQ